MTELPEQWLVDVETRLAEVLNRLDENDEPLIAAHVAAALECVGVRLRGRGE